MMKKRGYQEIQPTDWPQPRPKPGARRKEPTRSKIRETARAPKPTRAT